MKTLTNKTLTGIEEIDTKLITNELSLTYFLIMARAHNLSDELVLNLISEVWPTKKSMKNEDVSVIKQHLKDGAWKHVFKKHPDPAIRKLCITPACEDIFDELVRDENRSVRMAFINNSSLFIVNNYYPILAKDPNPNIRMRIANQAYFLKDLVLDEDPNVSFAALQTIANCNKMSDKLFEDVLKDLKYNQDFLIEETVNPTLLKHFAKHALEDEDRKKARFKLDMLYKVQNLKQEIIQSDVVDYGDIENFVYQLFYAF